MNANLQKYLKYKSKYLDLKNELMGGRNNAELNGGFTMQEMEEEERLQRQEVAERAAATRIQSLARGKADRVQAAARKTAASDESERKDTLFGRVGKMGQSIFKSRLPSPPRESRASAPHATGRDRAYNEGIAASRAATSSTGTFDSAQHRALAASRGRSGAATTSREPERAAASREPERAAASREPERYDRGAYYHERDAASREPERYDRGAYYHERDAQERVGDTGAASVRTNELSEYEKSKQKRLQYIMSQSNDNRSQTIQKVTQLHNHLANDMKNIEKDMKNSKWYTETMTEKQNDKKYQSYFNDFIMFINEQVNKLSMYPDKFKDLIESLRNSHSQNSQIISYLKKYQL